MNITQRFKVGIDLTPIAFKSQAPGTAIYVREQAQALLALDVPWIWQPVIADIQEMKTDYDFVQIETISAQVKSRFKWGLFDVGQIWRKNGCHLGFATAYFVPIQAIPAVANYFDANYFEKVDSWSRRQNYLKFLLLRQTFVIGARKALRIFVLSEYVKNRLSHHMGVPLDKIVVTYCGLRRQALAPFLPPHLLVDVYKPFFLYVGAVSDNKNQKNLIAAWSLLQRTYPDLPALILIGPFRKEYMNEVLFPILQELPRPNDVLFTGFTTDAAIAWAYEHALAYIQPSFAEGFGMPIIEAMSNGLPVACSDSTSLPEVAGKAALLFDPNRPDDISKAVLSIWKDAGLRSLLITLGEKRAKEFTWEKNARIVAQTIEEELRRIPLRH